MEKTKLRHFLLLGLIMISSNLLIAENNPVPVLDLRMDGDDAFILIDSSPFLNNAKGIALPYEDIFKRFPRENNGEALKIGNCVGSKGWVNGAVITPAASLEALQPIFEFDIKPLKKRQLRPSSNILCAHITPFFYAKAKKAPACKIYRPLQISLLKDNGILLKLFYRDKEGQIKSRSFKSPSVEFDKFTSVKWILDGKQVSVALNGKKVKSWPFDGEILYEHPDYYPENVAWIVGSGTLEALLDNFKIYDSAMAKRKSPVAVKIKTEHYMNFFTQSEPKRFFIDLENFGKTSLDGVLSYQVTDHEKREIFKGEKKVALKPERANRIEVDIPSEKRGCFWLKCEFKSKDGKIIAAREESYGVGAIRDVKDFPDSAPFGLDTAEVGFLRHRVPPVGAKWVRLWFRGDKLVPKEGEYKWELLDKAIDYHHDEGRKIMACLMGTPLWAASQKAQELFKAGKIKRHKRGKYPPEDWDKYRDYLRLIVKRYRDKVDVWEIWNEANTSSWMGTPEEFVKLMKMTNEVVRELDPTAKILGPSVAAESGWSPWAGEILDLEGGQYMDIYAYHYGGGGFSPNPNPEKIPQEFKDTQAMLKHYGKLMPIWDGETGYIIATRRGSDNRPTTKAELKRRQKNKEGFIHDSMVPNPRQANNWAAHDERTVSDYWLRKITLGRASGVVKDFLHAVGWMTYNRYCSHYCRHADGILMPAIVWTTCVEKFNHAKFIRKVALDDNHLYGYLFENERDDKYFAVLWNTEGVAEINLRPDSDSVVMLDKFGNPLPLKKINDGMIQVNLSGSPIYLEDVGENIKLGEKYLSLKVPEVIVAPEKNVFRVIVDNPRSEELIGEVRVSAPKGIQVDPKNFKIKIEPGNNFTQSFEVSPSIDLSGKKSQIELVLYSEDEKSIAKAMTMFLVEKAPALVKPQNKKIIVDGKIGDGEWEGHAPLIMDDEQQVVSGKPICYGDPATWKKDVEWWGPEDLSAQAQFCHDGENLYLLLKVRDDQHVISERNKRPWLSDGVEFFLDCRTPEEQKKTFYSPGVTHIVLSPGDEKDPKAIWTKVGTSAVNNKWKVEVASQKTADGYILEAKIPFEKSIFPGFKIEDGKIIGLDLTLVDSDTPGKRKSQMVWRGTKNNYRNPSKFGKIIFGGDKK